MSEENVTKANEFHKSFPQYSVTPLQKLSTLASYLGVKGIYCKDESYRFGLNAFKVLGGSYAMGRYIAKEAGIQALGQDVRIAHLEALAVEGRIEGACVAADGCKSGGLLLTVIVGAPLIIGIKVNGPLLQEGIGLVGGIGQQVRQVVAACVDRIILRRIVVAEAVQVPGIPDRET